MTDTQKLLALSQVCTIKDQREAYTVIHFTGTHAVVTDGFMLAKIASGVQPSEDMKARDLIAEPYTKMKPFDLVDQKEGKIIQATARGVASGVVTPREVPDLQYPKYDTIEKKKGDNTHLRMGLSLCVLEKIVKIMKKSEVQTIALEYSENPLSAIYGSIGEIDLTIMPCRVE